MILFRFNLELLSQHNFLTSPNLFIDSRSQKHYPAPLAIPLPNYSFDQGGKDMMERETSQRFGTIPRVSTIQDRTRSDRISTRAHSERGRDKEARSVHIESSEDDAYLAKSSLQPR